MPSRIALLTCFALVFVACASTVSATRAPEPDAAAPADVPNLDDPMLRIQCPPGQPDPCGPGRHCIAVGPGFLGVCVRDGGHGGLCRITPLACDESIPCIDQWCDQHGSFSTRTACGDRLCGLAEGCVEVEGALHCVTNGGAGGYCRQGGTGDGCDLGLRCDQAGNNRSRCGRPIAPNEPCSLVSNGVDFCDVGTTCAEVDGVARCRVSGSSGTPCTTSVECAAGLECQLTLGGLRPLCVRPGFVGEPCDTSAPGAPRCATGTSCAAVESGRQLCEVNGTFGALCRDSQPPCDGDLLCHPTYTVCARPLSEGESCDPSSTFGTCVDGSTCVDSTTGGGTSCRPDGMLNTHCRRSKEPCDVGLVCDFGHGQLCHRP